MGESDVCTNHLSQIHKCHRKNSLDCSSFSSLCFPTSPSSLLVLMVQLARGIYKQTNKSPLPSFCSTPYFLPIRPNPPKMMPMTKSSKFSFKGNTTWKCHYFRCVCVAWHGNFHFHPRPHPHPHPQILPFLFIHIIISSLKFTRILLSKCVSNRDF